MTIRTIGLLATATLALALGACGNDAKPTAAPSAATTTSDGEPAPVMLTASGAPKRASGYWTLKNIGASGTVIGTQYLCVGAGSEERGSVFTQIAINANCSRYDFKRDGARWTFDTSCGAAPFVSEAKGTIIGDFADSYKVELQVTEEGRTMGRTIEASKSGACPAGSVPGDLNDESGKKIANIAN